MKSRHATAGIGAALCAAGLLAAAFGNGLRAQSGGPGSAAAAFSAATDANKDGALTREELKSAFDRWFAASDAGKRGSVTQEQIADGLSAAFPPPVQNRTPNPSDVQAMMAALPDKAPAVPKAARKVLVLARAAGYVHSSIPLAARTVEEMGKKTGAWSTTITYDAADIHEANLKQYDAIFLASTTGEFLDDPNDAAATAARRKALLDFVRNGKGLAGVHAATDSYHRDARAADRGRARTPGRAPASPWGPAAAVARQMTAQGDTNNDRQLSRAEMAALADAWFDKIDPDKAGRVTHQDLSGRFAAILPPPPPPSAVGPTGFPVQPPATRLGPDTQVGTWPEWNKMIGGFFKFHWNDGQVITVKLDEPDHPLNAPFKRRSFQVMDEIYTYGREVYSRKNLRVLTSIDYAKMSPEDKAKEEYPRGDGDYAISWIHRDGKGRVFYEALGHSERVYAIRPILEHVLAGIQYVLGDLPADDRPSAEAGTR